jgi:hypothetical protein
VIYNVPENVRSVNIYNVLGQRVFEQNILPQPTMRVALQIEESGLLFVELRDENKNALVVMKAVKR